MLHQLKADDRADAEQQGVGDEGASEVGGQALAHQGQKGTTHPVAQQGQTDHHVGEVMPLNDGEEAHQQHFVGQRRRGNQQHRKDRR